MHHDSVFDGLSMQNDEMQIWLKVKVLYHKNYLAHAAIVIGYWCEKHQCRIFFFKSHMCSVLDTTDPKPLANSTGECNETFIRQFLFYNMLQFAFGTNEFSYHFMSLLLSYLCYDNQCIQVHAGPRHMRNKCRQKV